MKSDMLKYITASLKVLGLARIKFDVWIDTVPKTSYGQKLIKKFDSDVATTAVLLPNSIVLIWLGTAAARRYDLSLTNREISARLYFSYVEKYIKKENNWTPRSVQ